MGDYYGTEAGLNSSKCAGKERDSSQKEKHETNFPLRPFGNCFNCRCPFACRGSWRNVYGKMRQGRRGPFCVEPRGPVVALVRSKQKIKDRKEKHCHLISFHCFEFMVHLQKDFFPLCLVGLLNLIQAHFYTRTLVHQIKFLL